jgi:glycosyltransferase involved in cell wall biosynthesis
MIGYIIAGPESKPKPLRDMSCSVIVPCRNEAGNIEDLVRRLPALSLNTEIIFIDGKSTDGTVEKIKEMIEKYKGIKQIILLHQKVCDGKASAVWQGFEAAQNEIFFILDSDLTVPPEDLPKFYRAIVQGKAAFVNGTRLVYPLEKEAMRFLNFLANKMFGLIFTWLLEQRIKDTLCGTKVLTKKNYERIKALSSYFGDFDPFGDFLLLFGASYLGLKIIEVPIRYQARTYGEIKIKRFKHGLLLLKMTIIAFIKLKRRRLFRKK